MNKPIFADWRSSFGDYLSNSSVADSLKAASVAADLASWTSSLTTVILRNCEEMGWIASGRWNPSRRLPKTGKEYLGMDVMAFPQGPEPRWPMPLAVFELENSPTDLRVAYSLWKVLCLRVPLRVVFAYRPDWESSRELITVLAEDVIGGLSAEERMAIVGQTVVAVGNRGEGDTFPWGYFKFWMLNSNLGRFEKI